MSSPLVSVVVPTRNSAHTLDMCLQSIRNQSYINLELIVVDNFSTDETCKIATSFSAILHKKGPERSAQINFGVGNSHGKYVYRLDSDMIASEHVIEDAVNVCESKNLDGIIIRAVSEKNVSFWAKVRSYERANLYDYDINIAIRFLSRNAYDAIGGFDESLNGFEDYDLHDRFLEAGFKFGRISSAETHIGEPRTLAEIVRKHYYYGKDLKRYLSKKTTKVSRLSPMRHGHFQSLEKLTNDPKMMIGFVLYQSIRYVSTAIGMFAESK